MEQNGVVVKLEDGFAYVNVGRMSGCGSNCSACSGSCEVKHQLVRAENLIDAHVGDIVRLESEHGTVVKYMLLIYFFPMVLFISGIALGYYFFDGNELKSFVAGIVCLAVSALVIRYIDKNRLINKSIVKIVDIIK